MARVVVLKDPDARIDADVIMDETVYPLHLDDEVCAVQFLERLAWALEGKPRGRPAAPRKPSPQFVQRVRGYLAGVGS